MINGFTVRQFLGALSGHGVMEGEISERRLSHRFVFADNRGRRYEAFANDEDSARLSVGSYHRVDGTKLNLIGKPEELG